MSDLDSVLFGVGGATATLLVGQVMPWAVALGRGGPPPEVKFWKIVGGVIVAAISIGAGGLVAYLGDPSATRDAFTYGMGWQAVFAGVTGSVQAARVEP
jgi:hypothetical protein